MADQPKQQAGGSFSTNSNRRHPRSTNSRSSGVNSQQNIKSSSKDSIIDNQSGGEGAGATKRKARSRSPHQQSNKKASKSSSSLSSTVLSDPAEAEAAAPIRVTRRSSAHSNPDITCASASSGKPQAEPQQPLEAKSFVFKPRSPSESSVRSARSATSTGRRNRTCSVASIESTTSAASSEAQYKPPRSRSRKRSQPESPSAAVRRRSLRSNPQANLVKGIPYYPTQDNNEQTEPSQPKSEGSFSINCGAGTSTNPLKFRINLSQGEVVPTEAAAASSTSSSRKKEKKKKKKESKRQKRKTRKAVADLHEEEDPFGGELVGDSVATVTSTTTPPFPPTFPPPAHSASDCPPKKRAKLYLQQQQQQQQQQHYQQQEKALNLSTKARDTGVSPPVADSNCTASGSQQKGRKSKAAKGKAGSHRRGRSGDKTGSCASSSGGRSTCALVGSSSTTYGSVASTSGGGNSAAGGPPGSSSFTFSSGNKASSSTTSAAGTSQQQSLFAGVNMSGSDQQQDPLPSGSSSGAAGGAGEQASGGGSAAEMLGLPLPPGAGGASASAPALPGEDQPPDESDMGRLQALLEARGLPSHLFGTLGPRMHQLLSRSMGGGTVGKVQALLQGIQATGDQVQQMTAVVEMCQLLVMGNEETLAGFPVKQVVPALIALLQVENNFDMNNHACRALYYMMEALPRSTSVVVDAVPTFLQKVHSIQCMDVAEQALQALEKLSTRHSKAILNANGIESCLTYLDFFSLSAQQHALAITANACNNMNSDEFHYVRGSLQQLSGRLVLSDKKSTESTCIVFGRLIDNFQTDERVLKEIAAHGLLANVQQLLMASPPVISSPVFVTVMRMLVIMCASCPDLAVILLKQNIADTLCYLLVGSAEQTGASEGIELVQRSPPETYEIVSLIGELMPKLPCDGVFAVDGLLRKNQSQNSDPIIWQWKDDRGMWHSYTHLDSRIVEAGYQAADDEVGLTTMGRTYSIDFNTMTQVNEDTGTSRSVQRKANPLAAPASVSAHNLLKSDSRADVLAENSELASSFIKALFGVLYEVYSASAGPGVRHRCLGALLRMVYYAPADLLRTVLNNISVSSHIAAMLASHDIKVVVAAVQMAVILMEKLNDVFSVYFRREGVMHKMEELAQPGSLADLSPKKAHHHHQHTPSSSSLQHQHSSMYEDQQAGTSSSASSSTTDMDLMLAAASAHDKPSSSPATTAAPQTAKFSDVLKRKKAPKRGGSGRKNSGSGASGGGSSSRHPHLDDFDMFPGHPPPKPATPASPTPAPPAASGGAGARATPTTRGKAYAAAKESKSSGAATKSSFLTTLKAWGRSSSHNSPAAPERPPPPTSSSTTTPGGGAAGSSSSSPSSSNVPVIAKQSSAAQQALQAAQQAQANREKVKQWIRDEAIKFCAKYLSGECVHATHPDAAAAAASNGAMGSSSHPAMSILNRLQAATQLLAQPVQNANQVSAQLSALIEIAEIMGESDVSFFELIHSGLVGKLLHYLTDAASCRDNRLRSFLHVFLQCPPPDVMVVKERDHNMSTAPLTALVTKLMGCFHHLEQFQVKVHDFPGQNASTSRGGSNAMRFFNTHQLKCNLQRHPDCKTLRQWKGGPVKIDPLALVLAIERYLVMRGYGREGDDDCSDEENSDDDLDDTMAAVGIAQGTAKHRLQFVIGNQPLPYQMTVYQAVKQYTNTHPAHLLLNPQHPHHPHAHNHDHDLESENPYGPTSIWTDTHTIYYRSAPEGGETAACSEGSLAQASSSSSSSSPKKTKSERHSKHSPKSKKDELWTEGRVNTQSPTAVLDSFLSSSLPASVTCHDPSVEVLALLRVLHALYRNWTTLYESVPPEPEQSCSSGALEYISSKLSAKATRQLQDPLVIMTGNMPTWLTELGYACPFLMPFDTRQMLLYATAFDRDRAMQRLQEHTANENTAADSATDSRVGPRLDKRKRSVRREDILKQAEKLMEELGTSRALLEIQYEQEVGTGLGPTLEFYALVSRELQRSDLDLWRGTTVRFPSNAVPSSSSSKQKEKEQEKGVDYMFADNGLFPAALGRHEKSSKVSKVKAKFKFLGKLMAKALMDSRMLDLPLSPVFYKWLLKQEQSLSAADLQYVTDPTIYRTYQRLEEMLRQKKRIETDTSHTAESRRLALDQLTMDGCPVEDLSIYFLMPSDPRVELRKGGKDIQLTLDNIEEYLKLVMHWSLHEGVYRQMESLREGFESVMPLSHLLLFYPEELDRLFCGNPNTQWDLKTLTENCKLDHGYTHDSNAVTLLFSVLSSYNAQEQRDFLKFITGSPRLPVGGLKSLSPPLTIVRKTLEGSSGSPDDYLPSVMTCVNYLKLPDYSSEEVMRERLSTAAKEGQTSFHLS